MQVPWWEKKLTLQFCFTFSSDMPEKGSLKREREREKKSINTIQFVLKIANFPMWANKQILFIYLFFFFLHQGKYPVGPRRPNNILSVAQGQWGKKCNLMLAVSPPCNLYLWHAYLLYFSRYEFNSSQITSYYTFGDMSRFHCPTSTFG